jgi:hypothetical protein
MEVFVLSHREIEGPGIEIGLPLARTRCLLSAAWRVGARDPDRENQPVLIERAVTIPFRDYAIGSTVLVGQGGSKN